MRTKLFLSGVILSAVLFSTCRKESVSHISCDTSGWIADSIRYSNVVAPILFQNCLGCHSNASQQGKVSLEGYDNVKTYVDNDRLLGTIGHLKHYKPMPQNAGKLPDDQVCKIKFWIDNGAKND